MDSTLPEPFRRHLFAALVDLQDEGEKPEEARALVAVQFAVGVEVVKAVEEEGLAGNWPPL
jgi:hypothetical protein